MPASRFMNPALRLDDQPEAVGQVVAGAAVELHPCAVLAGDAGRSSRMAVRALGGTFMEHSTRSEPYTPGLK